MALGVDTHMHTHTRARTHTHTHTHTHAYFSSIKVISRNHAGALARSRHVPGLNKETSQAVHELTRMCVRYSHNTWFLHR